MGVSEAEGPYGYQDTGVEGISVPGPGFRACGPLCTSAYSTHPYGSSPQLGLGISITGNIAYGAHASYGNYLTLHVYKICGDSKGCVAVLMRNDTRKFSMP